MRLLSLIFLFIIQFSLKAQQDTTSKYLPEVVFIACGGTKLGTKKGNSCVAFALQSFFETRKNELRDD